MSDVGPSMMYFKSKKCAPCTKFQEVLDAYELETGRRDHMIVDIEEDDAMTWTHLYQVKSVPTLVLFGPEGETKRRINCGHINLEGLKALVEICETPKM